MARKKRYIRDPQAQKRQPRAIKTSLDVLELVYSQEYIRSSHLDPLIPNRPPNGIRQTLAILHTAGYLEKVVDSTQSIYCPDIYYITNEGERFLRTYRNPDHYVRTYRPRGDYRIEYEHKLGIADTIANLRAGALKAGCTFISQAEIERGIGKEDDTPLKLPASVECELAGQWRSWKGDIEPDGLFGIEYPDGTRSYIALEYQNTGKVKVNTLMGVSSMRRKYLAYTNVYQTKAFNLWGIRNLRVLFVFAHERDFRQSLILGEELFPSGSPMFLHTHQPNHRETNSRFLVAPRPNPELFTTPLARIGRESIALFQ